jgi:hypothetical protein
MFCKYYGMMDFVHNFYGLGLINQTFSWRFPMGLEKLWDLMDYVQNLVSLHFLKPCHGTFPCFFY